MFCVETVFTQTTHPDFHAGTHGFIENNGQIRDQNGKPNPSVKYLLSVAPGMNLQLKKNGFSYDTYTSDDTAGVHHLKRKNAKFSWTVTATPTRFHFHRVDISFLGASENPVIRSEEPLPYDINYPNHIKVHTYQRITYKNIYPSIDLVFDAGNAKAEYNFVIRPGGDPHKISMHFAGAGKTALIENQIRIRVDKGEWDERIPASYAGKEKVLVRYKAVALNTYGFDIGNYNHKDTLTIDPTPDLIWGTYLGGDLNDWGLAIAADANGNTVMGGASDNPGIATTGAFKTVKDGYGDAILGKFTNDGKALWITYFGGSSEDVINGLAVDQYNNIVSVGYTFSADQIATPGSYKTIKVSPVGNTDAFVAKFTPDGSLLWSTYYGGDSVTWSSGVAVDRNNNIFIAAWTSSANGISTPGVYQTLYGGGTANTADDGCVAKFSPDGKMQWSTYYGENDFDRFYGIAIDKQQNLYLSGITYSRNKIATPGSYQPLFGGGVSDAFLVKFSNDGARLWATYYGGAGLDYAQSVCTDGLNNVFICGMSASLNGISTNNGPQPNFGGSQFDGFLAKFSADGQRSWGSYYGGSGEEYVDDIAADDQNNIYISGSTSSPDHISTPGSYQPAGAAGGWWTAYLASFNNAGVRQWGTYYGENGPYGGGEAYGVVTFGGFVFITGETTNTDHISTCDAYQKNWVNNQDAFLAKFGPDLIPSVSITDDPATPICSGETVNFTASALNTGNNVTYQWYWNGNPVGTNSPVYSNNQFSDMDSIRCLVEKSPGCATQGVSSNSVIIQVDPALPVSVTIAGPTDSICQGEKTIFIANATNGGTKPSYQWLVNGTDVHTDSSVFISNSLVNGDNVVCIVTHPAACTVDSIGTSNSIAIKVKSIPSPAISITASANPVCSGDPVIFTADLFNAGASPVIQWQINGIAFGDNNLQNSFSTLKNGDQVDCILTANISGCSLTPLESNIITENVLPVPVITISGDSVITRGGSAQLQALVSGNSSSLSWTPASSLNFADILNPIAKPDLTTKYVLQVTADNGCTGVKNFTVQVITKITIPNAFTPNGDGKNELFHPLYGSDISDVVFTVYNRWGQLVFLDKGAHKGWDGNLEGIPQPAGTYVWEFRYKSYSGESKFLSGTVLLIR